MIFYFNAPPKKFGIKTHFKEKTFGHYIKRGSKRTDINPTCFNKKNISLKNLDRLKKKLNIERIHMFDRISGLNKNILIAAHGNSIRALCKYLFEIDNEKISKLEIPTGNPLLITFDNNKVKNANYLDASRAKDLIKF